jgi:hypothetical protein
MTTTRKALLAALAVLSLAGCGTARTPAPRQTVTSSPSSLIPDTAADRAACRQFAAEQAGQLTFVQLQIWLTQNGGYGYGPVSSTGMSLSLLQVLSQLYFDAYVAGNSTSGDVAQITADCASIGAG